MKQIERRTKTDPFLYSDMETYLGSGEWQIEYDSPSALWLRWNRDRLLAVAAFDLEEARRLLAQVPPEDTIVLRGCEGLREMASGLGFAGYDPCRQAVYDKIVPIPIRTELTIRHPDGKDFPKVAESYDLVGTDELRADFEREDFLGGYLDETLVGYTGLHSEGSMGMLHVFPLYRRRGYAEALYGTLVNNQLRKGRLPFAHIFADNEASLLLHRRLGFRISAGLIHWMRRGDCIL